MPSIREEVADGLSDTCYFGDLEPTKSRKLDDKGKDFWQILFNQGEIRVYSESLIFVYSPKKLRLRTESEAKSFIMRNFVANALYIS